jgi:hypothetical protein
VSVTEPSDAVNAGMAIQTEGRRLGPLRESLPSVRFLVGCIMYHQILICRNSALCSQTFFFGGGGVSPLGVSVVNFTNTYYFLVHVSTH